MSEQKFRNRVIRELRPLDAVSVENPAFPGTPDVNYIEGWVELKWLRAWPADANTPVRLEHYTQQQRVWATRRRHRGGRCFLLLQVQDEYLLFDGRTAAEVLGHSTREALEEHAIQVWKGGMKWHELKQRLQV